MTNLTSVEAPPPRKRSGGCGKGCLVLLVLLILLLVALIAGTYIGVRHYYLAPEPVEIPETTVSSENADQVRERVDNFADAAREAPPAALAAEPPRSELSADDINALIERNPKSQGVAAVSIEGDVARVQMSIPLKRLDPAWQRALGLEDQYLNAQFSVRSPAGDDPANLSVTDLTINGHGFPGDALSWGVMGRSLRGYVVKYAGEYHISKVQIADGKLILESGR